MAQTVKLSDELVEDAKRIAAVEPDQCLARLSSISAWPLLPKRIPIFHSHLSAK